MIRSIAVASLLAAGVLLVLPASLLAQVTSQPVSQTTAATAMPTSATDADIQMLRADIRDRRKQVVAANMTLTPDEATRFWPLYDQYTAEVRKINDLRWAMMQDYAANYSRMTDEHAKGYVEKSSKIDADLINLRLKYIPQFEKLLTPKKAVQFYQIDRRLDMLINLQLASLVPVVNPTN